MVSSPTAANGAAALAAEQLRDRRAVAGVGVDLAAVVNFLLGLRHKRLVDRAKQLVRDAPVDEEADRGEDDGHRHGEAERQADTDRQAAHGASARSR